MAIASLGLRLTGGRLYRRLPFKPWMYLLLASVFVVVRVTHANMVTRGRTRLSP